MVADASVLVLSGAIIAKMVDGALKSDAAANEMRRIMASWGRAGEVPAERFAKCQTNVADTSAARGYRKRGVWK